MIVGVGEIFRDFGLSSAAIQAPTLSREQRDNLFWINTGIGSPARRRGGRRRQLIAPSTIDPSSSASPRALSVTFVLNGLATQYRANLVRGHAFARVAVADVVAPVVALAVAVPRPSRAAATGHWSRRTSPRRSSS